jgi:uncharacterized protein
VIVVDANVLLYAVNESSPRHAAAKRWVEEALSGDDPVGFAWVVLLAFLRIVTLPALSPEPLTVADACDLIDDWLDAAPATVVSPTTRHSAILRGLLSESGTAGNLTTDAHLAALAVEYGARLCTFDRDFQRFPGVRSFSPPSP